MPGSETATYNRRIAEFNTNSPDTDTSERDRQFAMWGVSRAVAENKARTGKKNTHRSRVAQQ